MKAVKSFDVMESFGMKDLENEELMEVDGGDTFTPCFDWKPTNPTPCLLVTIPL